MFKDVPPAMAAHTAFPFITRHFHEKGRLGGEVRFYIVFFHRKGGFGGKVHQIARFIHPNGCSGGKT